MGFGVKHRYFDGLYHPFLRVSLGDGLLRISNNISTFNGERIGVCVYNMYVYIYIYPIFLTQPYVFYAV